MIATAQPRPVQPGDWVPLFLGTNGRSTCSTLEQSYKMEGRNRLCNGIGEGSLSLSLGTHNELLSLVMTSASRFEATANRLCEQKTFFWYRLIKLYFSLSLCVSVSQLVVLEQMPAKRNFDDGTMLAQWLKKRTSFCCQCRIVGDKERKSESVSLIDEDKTASKSFIIFLPSQVSLRCLVRPAIDTYLVRSQPEVPQHSIIRSAWTKVTS